MKHDIERIVSESIFPLDSNVCGNGFRITKEDHRVVDQVRGNIEKDAAPRTRATARSSSPAPGARARVRGAAVIRFESDDAAKNSVRNKFSNGLKIAVVAAVLISGEQAACILRNGHKCLGVVESRGKGLFNQPAGARRKALPRELIMYVVGRSDDDQ